MSADRLREAAQLMRERWRVIGDNSDLLPDTADRVSMTFFALADWLDACALVQEAAPTRVKANALAVADAYLGTP